jgi:hypothetical protein
VLQLQNVLKHDKTSPWRIMSQHPFLPFFPFPSHLKVIYKISSFLFLKESGPSLEIFKNIPLVNEQISSLCPTPRFHWQALLVLSCFSLKLNFEHRSRSLLIDPVKDNLRPLCAVTLPLLLASFPSLSPLPLPVPFHTPSFSFQLGSDSSSFRNRKHTVFAAGLPSLDPS